MSSFLEQEWQDLGFRGLRFRIQQLEFEQSRYFGIRNHPTHPQIPITLRNHSTSFKPQGENPKSYTIQITPTTLKLES